MERWVEVFAGKIPTGIFQLQMENGEEHGLVIRLSNDNVSILIKFGTVYAVRMLDEGIVQGNLYAEHEISKYRRDGFKNVIYEVSDGKFGNQINEITNGYGDFLNLKHYVIISSNYNIDVVTEWEPDITFL